MTGEIQTVTQQTVGFSFQVSIEKEIRSKTAAKYPDKQVLKVSLGGHAETLEAAQSGLETVSEKVKEQIAKLEGSTET